MTLREVGDGTRRSPCGCKQRNVGISGPERGGWPREESGVAKGEGNPQLEDGYARTANETLEQLARIRIPGEARQNLDVIFRKTYGWKQKTARITLDEFCNCTGMKKPEVIRGNKRLLEMRLITIGKIANDTAKIYSFNKHYNEWEPLAKKQMLAKLPTLLAKLPTPIYKYNKDEVKDNNKDKEKKSLLAQGFLEESYMNKETDPRIKRLVDWWNKQWLEIFKRPPIALEVERKAKREYWGKTAKFLERLLLVYKEAEIQGAMTGFLRDKDPWLVKRGYDISELEAWIQAKWIKIHRGKEEARVGIDKAEDRALRDKEVKR